MIIYKLTCETGKVYYGSTSLTLKQRAGKGWYHCSCKDFNIVKKEVLEEVETKQEALERESYYIENFECVNRNTAKQTPEYKRLCYIKWRENNIERINNTNKTHRDRVIKEKRFYCELCDMCFQAPAKLTRHKNGYRHKLKDRCRNELGDDWKLNYKKWKEKRY